MDNEYSVSPCKLTLCINIKCKWLNALHCESDMRHFETQSVCFRRVPTLAGMTFAGWQSMHVKRSLSMYKEHSISAAYRPLYHFHIGSGHHTTKRLSWLPANLSQWWVLGQCWIWWSLLTVWTLLWYYETRLLGERPETSLCFYLLVWPQIKRLQRHQTCVEAKETRTKGFRCIYECSYNSGGYLQPSW